MRNKFNLYPDFGAEIKEIEVNGISTGLINTIINKHASNASYNRSLYERYEVLEEGVPIFSRHPRFQENGEPEPINNKINNDFFSEIIDFETGYFAGNPISYSYSKTEESEDDTGGNEAVEAAAKALSDFVTRNNMFEKDMEMTKHAACYGYVGRLFYHDEEGNERVMIVPGYETIILSKTDITEPQYAIRYYSVSDINGSAVLHVEFYDDKQIKFYEGQPGALTLIEDKPNLYDFCPLQGIPKNGEKMGSAEKVLADIDAYDRTVSDNSNDIESFASAYIDYENIQANEDEIRKAQRSGAIKFTTGAAGGKVYYLTKDINDAFTEHHLERLEKNIYRFSKTPNLNDESFGNASGTALKFKLTALESKCGMFEAKVISAVAYMFKLLASSWRKKRISVEPLQCVMEFKRNFPLDILGESQAAQALINTGMPKEIAWDKSLSFIDDIDYVMQLVENEKDGIPPLSEPDEENSMTEETDGGE